MLQADLSQSVLPALLGSFVQYWRPPKSRNKWVLYNPLSRLWLPAGKLQRKQFLVLILPGLQSFMRKQCQQVQSHIPSGHSGWVPTLSLGAEVPPVQVQWWFSDDEAGELWLKSSKRVSWGVERSGTKVPDLESHITGVRFLALPEFWCLGLAEMVESV